MSAKHFEMEIYSVGSRTLDGDDTQQQSGCDLSLDIMMCIRCTVQQSKPSFTYTSGHTQAQRRGIDTCTAMP